MRKATTLGAIAGVALACLGASPVSAVEADRAAKRFTVTAKVNNVEPMRGDRVKVRGKVTPARPGEVVKLQLRYGAGTKWKTIDTDELNRQGKYKFFDKVKTVRFRQYRVLKPASGDRRAGKSPKVGVTVYDWRDLTSLSPASASNTFEVPSVTMNAIAYPKSLLGNGNPGSIDYNLNRACKTLEGTFGLDDTSAASATGTVELRADGASRYAGAFTLTQSQFVSRDVRGVFRISVLWSSANTEGTPENQSGAKVAVGSPRVLCSF